MDRRTLLALMPAVALAPALLSLAPPIEEAFAQGVDPNAILNDPEVPVSGNPKGDLTIVAFLDYNCPFCKKAEPDLIRLVKADGRIRLVHKDWPILGDASVYGAQLALAAKYQGRYDEVHRALMGIPGRKIPKERMLEAVAASGVDVARLEEDRKAHQAEIAALLQRNLDQADALGLQGTPVFLIGQLKVAAALDYDGFRQAVAQARAPRRARSTS
jgi:protein-disulfide isomerase